MAKGKDGEPNEKKEEIGVTEKIEENARRKERI
jgi:hypothetical protein